MIKRNTTVNLVLTALMMSIVVVLTYIIRIPIPGTQGYIHLGDSMILFSVLLLGWKWGAVAGSVGSALADMIAGYQMYAPITFLVKGLMAIVLGLMLDYVIKKGFSGNKLKIVEALSLIVAGGVMIGGYFLAEGIMYGSYAVAAVAIPMNIVQFVVGIVVAIMLANALYKTPAKKEFVYILK